MPIDGKTGAKKRNSRISFRILFLIFLSCTAPIPSVWHLHAAKTQVRLIRVFAVQLNEKREIFKSNKAVKV